MIVKFDHISYISDKSSMQSVLEKQGEPLFYETCLKNLDTKKQLMCYPQDDHDLYFYDTGYPVEYIFYDRVSKKSGIRLEEDILYGSYNDINKAKVYLEAIFKGKVSVDADRIICNMRGVLDKSDFRLVLEPSVGSGSVTYVDAGGYGVPALIISGDYRQLNNPDIGSMCTPWSSLTVNGRVLNISFAVSDHTNIIFELIRPEK